MTEKTARGLEIGMFVIAQCVTGPDITLEGQIVEITKTVISLSVHPKMPIMEPQNVNIPRTAFVVSEVVLPATGRNAVIIYHATSPRKYYEKPPANADWKALLQTVQDQCVLKYIALNGGNAHWDVTRTALDVITDETVLAEVVLESDKESRFRECIKALGRIANPDLLSKILTTIVCKDDRRREEIRKTALAKLPPEKVALLAETLEDLPCRCLALDHLVDLGYEDVVFFSRIASNATEDALRIRAKQHLESRV